MGGSIMQLAAVKLLSWPEILGKKIYQECFVGKLMQCVVDCSGGGQPW
jgi:hypothetical protein